MRPSTCFWLTFCIILGLCAFDGGAQTPAPAPDCSSALISLLPCLDYVQGNVSAPPQNCCVGLGNVVLSNPICLCTLFNSSALPIQVNTTRALLLPALCGVTSNPSLCGGTGAAPVQAPTLSPPVSTPVPPPTAPTTPPTGTPPSTTPVVAPSVAPSVAPTVAPSVSPVVAPSATSPGPAPGVPAPTPATPVPSPTPTAASPPVATPATTPTGSVSSPPAPPPATTDNYAAPIATASLLSAVITVFSILFMQL